MTSSAIVNIGTAANSGNGDPLRNAFAALNTRLQQIAALYNGRGEWATATEYSQPNRDWVTHSAQTYVCVVSHTAGVFATDLAAGKWVAVDVVQLAADLVSGGGAGLVGTDNGRNVQQRLDDFFSGADAGVVGDGLADDTAAIQAAASNSRPVNFEAPALNLSQNVQGEFFSIRNPQYTGVGFLKGVISMEQMATQSAPRDYVDILKRADYRKPTKIWIEEKSANRFQVYLPLSGVDRRETWRLDNANTNFTDGTAGVYTRPYIITTITENAVTNYVNYAYSSGIAVGTWVAGTYPYSQTTGDTITFTVTGTSIRLTYLEATNAGIATITVDGAPANAAPSVDMYGTSGSSKDVFIAQNLADTTHTVTVTVSGTKNASSTGYRIYLYSVYTLRAFQPVSYLLSASGARDATQTETAVGYWKLSNSAVDYAIAYRPNSLTGASTPFTGSVHGYENRSSIEFYVDGVLQSDFMVGGAYNKYISGDQITVIQKSKIQHPDNAGVDYAEVTITHCWSATDGYSQATKWTWLNDVYVENGYSQMFTANGGNAGGDPNVQNGWCNRVTFHGCGTYSPTSGQGADFGFRVTPQVVFWGTPYAVDQASRDIDSGTRAIVVSIPDFGRSMNYFENEQSRVDLAWVKDNANMKKLYVQHYRGAGTITAGNGFSGRMAVNCFVLPFGADKLLA